ncbi:hypothetical protein B0H34DRAFT_809548 [Crassisporium funariophilum]|nr:hypothetical protein B0H34DRAFT_809548 [Crassisporium funariophilum]
MANQSDNEEHQENEETLQKRRGRLINSLDSRARKRKRNQPIDPYKKFVCFYTRSQDVFVNYSNVLDAGMSWEVREFGELTEQQFIKENRQQLKVYKALCAAIPQFAQDFFEFQEAPEELEGLAKQLNEAVTSARGADISTLREAGLEYVALEQPGEELLPKIKRASEKKSTRGHNHIVLLRLLCPVKHLNDFDANPEEFWKKLLRNTVKVFAGDYPALLYPLDGYDSEDPESGLLRNPTLVRFFKHIFTAPTSAKDAISAPTKTKTKRPQAQLNNMKKVTPGSIVYAALMFRHCISALDDWRTEDDLFDCSVFAQSLLDLLKDPKDTWTKDTLEWWNVHVFGTPPNNEEDENREPSTADIIREKRAARKAAEESSRNVGGRPLGLRQQYQRHEGQSSSPAAGQHSPRTNRPYDEGVTISLHLFYFSP